MPKVTYINKNTGKEVQYGEYITNKEIKCLNNGYRIYIETTYPVINETLPILIEKGIIVQNSEEVDNYTVEEKLNILSNTITDLFSRIESLEKALCNYMR